MYVSWSTELVSIICKGPKPPPQKEPKSIAPPPLHLTVDAIFLSS